MGIRNSLPSIKDGVITSYPDNNVVAFKHTSGSGEILVVASVKDRLIDFIVPKELENSKWINTDDQSTITLSEKLTLPPYNYLILLKLL